MKIFNSKNYSFSTKMILVFFIIIIFLIINRTFFALLKIKDRDLNREINSITRTLSTITKQIKILDKYMINKNILNYKKDEKEFKLQLYKNSIISSRLKSSKIELLWVEPNNSFIPTKNYPLESKINNNTILTWIMAVPVINTKKVLYLKYSINKKDIESKHISNLVFLLPETLVSLLMSFFLILIFFKRILKNINKLTKTAIYINQGEINIRSNVKGDDDIGILGRSFDSMLDFFENNIKSLDNKVKEKTKEISRSLEEKEILLKEIHHRVKNNLALTISLIELQEDEIEDEKTKNALINIKERIYTMELIHRKLYESTDLTMISLNNYVIDLINTISKAYNKQEVNMDIQIEDIFLNIETAIPFGLIINELITNAFKYAFTNKNSSKLEVLIIKQKNNELFLIIKDNGKGLKENFSDISNKTLGLKLINIIIKLQLMGKITYEYDNGAKFTIVCKIKE